VPSNAKAVAKNQQIAGKTIAVEKKVTLIWQLFLALALKTY
jgi:hypothetical protein